MRIVIIGSGYVGLVSGACLAHLGHDVVCVDKNIERVRSLRRGQMPIYEPGLDAMILRNQADGRLGFEEDVAQAGRFDIALLAVGTPPRPDGMGADLSQVMSAAQDLAEAASFDFVLVTKSTVPVGTGDLIEDIVRSARPDLSIEVASNPEFLREGSAIGDFMRADRIVIGVEGAQARERLERLYAPLTAKGVQMQTTSRRAAELIKYAANAFLATKISFINEIADLCEAVGADVREVARGVGLDRRIGSAFLEAGPGYGGSCFPKDSMALLSTARDHGVRLRVLESTVAVNARRRRDMANRIIAAMGGDVEGRTIGFLGLTFKANTDDMRDAPAVSIIGALQRAGAHIRAYDPQGMQQAALALENVSFSSSAYACAVGADCLVLATDWEEFDLLSPESLAAVTARKVFVDLRNQFSPHKLASAGFTVHSVGRPVVEPEHPIANGYAVGAAKHQKIIYFDREPIGDHI